MDDIKSKYEYFFTYDQPIPFKGLSIYPVLVSEYFEFFNSIGCLTIEKDSIPDTRIIGMSYLDFLFDLIKSGPRGSEMGDMLFGILKLCLRVDDDDIKYIDNFGKITLVISGVEIRKKDFELLKRIICYQNTPDYDDTYIDHELREAIDEANRISNDTESPGSTSLERQMICIVTSTALTLDNIARMTIRKFVLMLQIVDSKLHYQIYKTGESSGMVSFKQPITHWMYSKNNKFDSLIKYGSFKEKMKQVT
jgi:hypothetical protein